MESTARPAASDGRLRCLDGLRGLLAAYVLLNHAAPLLALPSWLERLRGAFLHGQAAVDVFFILSGMVIVRSLASHGGGYAFLRARAWRTYPVYLAVLAPAILVQTLPSGLDRMPWAAPEAADLLSGGWPADAWARIAAHLTMTHGLLPDGVLPGAWIGFLGAAWSLSTEWQFYALVAVLAGALRGASRRDASRRDASRRDASRRDASRRDASRRDASRGDGWTLAALFVALAVAGALWQAGADPAWRFSRAFLPNKAAFFALGIASAGVGGAGSARARWAAVLAATLALCAVSGRPEKLLAPLIWTACLAAQLGWAPARPLARSLACAPLVRLGAVSYGLYLVNEPVQKLLALAAAALAGGDGRVFDALFLPGAVALPLLAARLLHAHVELPGVRRGRGGPAGALSAA